MSERFVLLTGCSSGGKSTLLEALGKRGFATVPEPGRRIIAEEAARNGKALPWDDSAAFSVRAVEMAKSDLEEAHRRDGLVFFDRGLVDAAVALEHSGGRSVRETLGEPRPYAKKVFVTPPWQELFIRNGERRHDFASAVQEYHRLNRALDDLGYSRMELPKISVRERVAIVLDACNVT